MTNCIIAKSPEANREYMIKIRPDGKIGYMQTTGTYANKIEIKPLKKCPKWMQEIINKEMSR